MEGLSRSHVLHSADMGVGSGIGCPGGPLLSSPLHIVLRPFRVRATTYRTYYVRRRCEEEEEEEAKVGRLSRRGNWSSQKGDWAVGSGGRGRRMMVRYRYVWVFFLPLVNKPHTLTSLVFSPFSSISAVVFGKKGYVF